MKLWLEHEIQAHFMLKKNLNLAQVCYFLVLWLGQKGNRELWLEHEIQPCCMLENEFDIIRKS